MKTYTFGRIAFNVLGLFIVLAGMGFVILKWKNEFAAVAAAVVLGVMWGWAEGRIFGGAGGAADDKAVGGAAAGKKFWLRHADGKVEAIAGQSREGVLKALKDFDWDAELAAEKKLGKNMALPPSLGLGTYGEGHFLNIMPRGWGLAHVLYTRQLPPPVQGGKGEDRKQQQLEETYKENFDLEKIEGVVDAYFAGDWGKLARLLR